MGLSHAIGSARQAFPSLVSPGSRLGEPRYNTLGENDPSEADEVGIEERSRERRRRIVANRTTRFEDAEAWDLEFWQQRTPEERLSALVAIRRDVETVVASRAPQRASGR